MRRDAALAALVKEADRHDWASDIESISRYSLSVHQATLRHIRVIRICGDRESLDELKKTIQALLERHEEREARNAPSLARVRIIWHRTLRSRRPVFCLEPTFIEHVIEDLTIAETTLAHQNMKDIEELSFLEASV